MARVLTDTLLAGQVDDALAFYRAYGPAGGHALHPLLVALREEPPKTIEYLQEPRTTTRAREASRAAASATNLASDSLRDFYCRPVGDTALNRYEIWERGGAVGDSVTPSIYCPEYRMHMVLKILSLPRPHDRMFSVGCGNAFVEADLQARGLRVQAIDLNEEAVVLAASKGVDAFTADYHALPPGHLAGFGVVYADGLIGHLYHPDTELSGFFETLLALKPAQGSWLVLSNDAPAQQGAGVVPHGKVPGFWLFSPEYLRDTAQRFGYTVLESYSFPYERPLSGLRNRTICVARVA
jgi:SAM-dependent methyltransferase